MTYHNTTNEVGHTLELFEEKAKRQEEIIYPLFKDGGAKSASMIYKRLGGKYLIGSVRRSLSNLKNEGKLKITDVLVMGMNGRREHLYKLKL